MNTINPELFNLIKKGLSNVQIAKELNISNDQVKILLKNLYKNLGVHNRIQALIKISELESQKNFN